MITHHSRRLLLCLLFAAILIASILALAVETPLVSPAEPDILKVRLPLVSLSYPWQSPFGVESNHQATGTLLDRAHELGTRYYRLHRVSWRAIQPDEGGPYDWSVLNSFDDELRSLRQAGFTTIVIVHHSPDWATINDPFPTDCGAIRADKFDAFAAFMQALVARYKQAEFGVHYWELGNEPDVDPTLVAPDSMFGCWGDMDDPYYGGRHYGEMLKVVYPAIKAIDPRAQVLVGGLLLGRPNTTVPPGQGRPELFLQGILEAGAAPYFDILPYHAHSVYLGQDADYDNGLPSPWRTRGGWTLGKARFLREMMAPYGVDKPLFLDETALGCENAYWPCDPPPADFFEAQANFAVRTFARDLSENIEAFIWYTLDSPGWRSTGLLDEGNNPRPAYYAYQQLVTRLQNGDFDQAVDYGPGVEAYRFDTRARLIDVLWSIDTISDTITVPQVEFVAAYSRDGAVLDRELVGSDYQLTVGFSPIYVERLP
jgi:hypothetical protein